MPRPSPQLLTLTNFAVASWYLFNGVFVLLRMRTEVLTGQSYDWPAKVIVTSVLGVFAALVVAAFSAFLQQSRAFGPVIVVSLGTLVALELFELVQLSGHIALASGSFVAPGVVFTLLGLWLFHFGRQRRA